LGRLRKSAKEKKVADLKEKQLQEENERRTAL
jgi:hypothetical protein